MLLRPDFVSPFPPPFYLPSKTKIQPDLRLNSTMPLLKGRYREQSRMDEKVYILYVILKSLISVSMCVSVLNERRSSQLQTQLLEIRNESLTFKIQALSWLVSSTDRALH